MLTKQVYKIVILGDQAVGKSSVANRIIEKEFEQNYLPTMAADLAVIEKKIELEDGDQGKFEYHYWDIAGQEQFKRVMPRFIKGTNGVIFIYDLTRKKSFIALESWLKLLIENNLENYSSLPVLIIGNKHDLPNHNVKSDQVVDFVNLLCDIHGFRKEKILNLTTSALTGYNVEKISEYFFNKLM